MSTARTKMNPPPLALLLALLTTILPSLSSQQEQCDGANSNNGDHQTCTPPQQEKNAHTRLPDDFVDPCQDENQSCPEWADAGECNNNPNYMLTSCARSCGSCHQGVEEERYLVSQQLCRDDYDDECGKWAEEGECSINPSFMHARCKYSCWKCVDVRRDRELGISEDVIEKKKKYLKMNTGRHQLVRGTKDMTKEDREEVIATLHIMDHYSKYTITDPSVDAKSRERCRNEFRMCAEWASRGMCLPLGHDDDDDETFDINDGAGKDDILFLLNSCPLACRMCEELESFHKCAGRRDPLSKPSFQSGELHSFFEGKRASEDWAEYEPLFVSYPEKKEGNREYDPYVVVLKKFLSDSEAEHLQSLGFDIGWTPSSPSDNYANSARCHNQEDQCNNDAVYQEIMKRISSLTNATISHLEPMEIVHFHSNSAQHKSTLQHNFEVSSLWMPAGPRVLSLFLFLSDIREEDGGRQLGFPYLDWLQIRPKKGMAVMWQNVRTDNLMESNLLTTFEHFHFEKEGESFLGANVHVRLYNWTDANIRGCA